ncbi:MAG: thiamine phosphate synthase [Alistipes sp.]|nr:thiamine phosphate synthase [Alistipes sp.]
MKIIAITTPKVIDEDAYIIKSLLDKGVDIVHLRKPESCIDDCRKLLSTLDAEYRASIVIHDYPELYSEFSLRGIHINRNVVALPLGYNGLKSRSCHSLEEVVRYKSEYDYLLLSPIFDSISKVGYRSTFNEDVLQRASTSGIIDSKVIALGGVTLDKISYLKGLNFGGAAMVGAIYNIDALDSLNSINIYK